MKFLKGKFKRVIAGALSLLMLVGVVPTTAFAADNSFALFFALSEIFALSQNNFQHSALNFSNSLDSSGKSSPS